MPLDIAADLAEACRSGQPVRVHTRDGEVLVARVLAWDGEQLVYAALQSSHPERYAVCDSTGFRLGEDAIRRTQLLRDPA